MIACLILVIVGFPLSRAVDRSAPLLRAIALGFLLATGLMTIVMLIVPWNPGFIIIAMALLSALSCFAKLQFPHRERLSPIALITLLMLIGYARYATSAPAWEVDFVADWGLKARVFFEHGGIDWSFLTNHWYRWSRQEYPPLVPFVYDFGSLLAGGWDDRGPSVFYAFVVGASLIIVQSLLTDEFESPHVAALATLAIAPLVATPWIGIGDTAFLAFAFGALVLIRRGGDSSLAGALLLGIAALTKNEGYALIIATVIAVAITRGWRTAARLWPAIAVALPWIALRASHHVMNELAAGDVAARFAQNARQWTEIIRLIGAHTTGKPLLWLGVVLSIACAARRWIERERLLLLIVALQMLAYVAAYLITPFGLEWHIRWSWDRIIWHIQLPVVFVAIVTAVPLALTRRPASAEPTP